MAWYRIYVDRKIAEDGTGGDHSRVFDVEADDQDAATLELELKADEMINSIVSLGEDPT